MEEFYLHCKTFLQQVKEATQHSSSFPVSCESNLFELEFKDSNWPLRSVVMFETGRLLTNRERIRNDLKEACAQLEDANRYKIAGIVVLVDHDPLFGYEDVVQAIHGDYTVEWSLNTRCEVLKTDLYHASNAFWKSGLNTRVSAVCIYSDTDSLTDKFTECKMLVMHNPFAEITVPKWIFDKPGVWQRIPVEMHSNGVAFEWLSPTLASQ